MSRHRAPSAPAPSPWWDPATVRVLAEVADERVKQQAKWGQQDHPDLPPGLVGRDRKSVFDYLGLRLPEEYKHDVDEHARLGESSWALIVLEEIGEAVDEAWAGDDDALRAELVQAAAVLTQQIEAIDRRRAGAGA